MKIESTEVYGFNASLRAMRNPMDSWDKSDSRIITSSFLDTTNKNFNIEGYILGNADKKLSQSLTKSGGAHRKHLRLISVWCDITLPRYIWQEMDTYKHKENVSCSTMHKLMSYPITKEMFEDGDVFIEDIVINNLNGAVDIFKQSDSSQRKKEIKYYAKSVLPESFLQKRTMWTNYDTLLNIHNQREFHELPQWHIINDWILELPYFTELTGVNE